MNLNPPRWQPVIHDGPTLGFWPNYIQQGPVRPIFYNDPKDYRPTSTNMSKLPVMP